MYRVIGSLLTQFLRVVCGEDIRDQAEGGSRENMYVCMYVCMYRDGFHYLTSAACTRGLRVDKGIDKPRLASVRHGKTPSVSSRDSRTHPPWDKVEPPNPAIQSRTILPPPGGSCPSVQVRILRVSDFIFGPKTGMGERKVEGASSVARASCPCTSAPFWVGKARQGWPCPARAGRPRHACQTSPALSSGIQASAPSDSSMCSQPGRCSTSLNSRPACSGSLKLGG